MSNIYQDEYDDFGPPQPASQKQAVSSGNWAQQNPFVSSDSRAQSVHTIVHAIGLSEGRETFTSPADVTRAMEEDMRDILDVPKSIHLMDTNVSKTASSDDMAKLISACFSMNGQQWATGDDHSIPAVSDVSIKRVAVVFARLRVSRGAVSREKGNNMAARKEITHRHVNGSKPTIKVTKPPLPQRPSTHRDASTQVAIALEQAGDDGWKYQYYDGAYRKLPDSFRPDSIVFLSTFRALSDVKLTAMMKHDRFWVNGGRVYNMKIAVAIARNRLTFYANGGHVNQRPQGEEEMKKKFIRYKLFSDMVASPDCLNAQARVKVLIPLPSLFHNII
ncbi:hypothetical protein Daus18300_006205 [Diaporthe australafricana]|uniref:Uncharacterized protein n=1 Tax=Diaporthe australafricana TaxID=127596 RepID=A0ABR3WX13_9PEZI